MTHWTDAQTWQERQTKEIVTAGELLKRYGAYLRTHRVSLCCLVYPVRMDDNTCWDRLRND